jgi:hypothetical protein
MSEPFRTTLPASTFHRTRPRWLARRLTRREEAWRQYEVALARLGRDIEIVTVHARSRDEAIIRAERYLFANIYARAVDGERLCPSWLPKEDGYGRQVQHADGDPRNNDPANLRVTDSPR